MMESGRRVENSFLFQVLVGKRICSCKVLCMWAGRQHLGRIQNDGGLNRCRSVPFNAPAGAVDGNAANAEVPALTRQNASCTTSLLCCSGWLRGQTVETSPLCCRFKYLLMGVHLVLKISIFTWRWYVSTIFSWTFPFFCLQQTAMTRVPLNCVTCTPSVSPPVCVCSTSTPWKNSSWVVIYLPIPGLKSPHLDVFNSFKHCLNHLPTQAGWTTLCKGTSFIIRSLDSSKSPGVTVCTGSSCVYVSPKLESLPTRPVTQVSHMTHWRIRSGYARQAWGAKTNKRVGALLCRPSVNTFGAVRHLFAEQR